MRSGSRAGLGGLRADGQRFAGRAGQDTREPVGHLGQQPVVDPGSASLAVDETCLPPLKLVLIEDEPGQDTRLDHLGVEVESADQVSAATGRLKDAGLATFEENDTSCCYALQDKVWVHGPGQEPWEVYVVKADADTLGKSADPDAGGDGCCTCQAPTPADAGS
ncbi:ArsI/CadI family heavy metal resistance metalloenzyme [Streptomyces sp. NPDC006173]|uniref:ArsI/CadI family heavy metal resistance metalloenzyme n=1 Tax=Streptomyces sp. NPDC006173 TaxID=3155349 RepID=UPI0033FB6F53